MGAARAGNCLIACVLALGAGAASFPAAVAAAPEPKLTVAPPSVKSSPGDLGLYPGATIRVETLVLNRNLLRAASGFQALVTITRNGSVYPPIKRPRKSIGPLAPFTSVKILHTITLPPSMALASNLRLRVCLSRRGKVFTCVSTKLDPVVSQVRAEPTRWQFKARVGVPTPPKSMSFLLRGGVYRGKRAQTLTGPDAASFVVTPDCSVPLRGTLFRPCNVSVTFAPSTVGEKSATLRLSGGPNFDATIALRGTALPPR